MAKLSWMRKCTLSLFFFTALSAAVALLTARCCEAADTPSSSSRQDAAAITGAGVYYVNRDTPRLTVAAPGGVLTIDDDESLLHVIVDDSSSSSASSSSADEVCDAPQFMVDLSGLRFRGRQSVLAVTLLLDSTAWQSEREEQQSARTGGASSFCRGRQPPDVHIIIRDVEFNATSQEAKPSTSSSSPFVLKDGDSSGSNDVGGVVVIAGNITKQTKVEMINLRMNTIGSTDAAIARVMPEFQGLYTGWTAREDDDIDDWSNSASKPSSASGALNQTAAAVVVGGGIFEGLLRIADSVISATTSPQEEAVVVVVPTVPSSGEEPAANSKNELIVVSGASAVLITELLGGELRCEGAGRGLLVERSSLTATAVVPTTTVANDDGGSTTKLRLSTHSYGLVVQTATLIVLEGGAGIRLSDAVVRTSTTSNKNRNPGNGVVEEEGSSVVMSIGGGIMCNMSSKALAEWCGVNVTVAGRGSGLVQMNSTMASECQLSSTSTDTSSVVACTAGILHIAVLSSFKRVAARRMHHFLSASNFSDGVVQEGCAISVASMGSGAQRNYATGAVMAIGSAFSVYSHTDPMFVLMVVGQESTIGQVGCNVSTLTVRAGCGNSLAESTAAVLAIGLFASVYGSSSLWLSIAVTDGAAVLQLGLTVALSYATACSTYTAHSSSNLMAIGSCSGFNSGPKLTVALTIGNASLLAQERCNVTLVATSDGQKSKSRSSSNGLAIGAASSGYAPQLRTIDLHIDDRSAISQADCVVTANATSNIVSGTMCYATSHFLTIGATSGAEFCSDISAQVSITRGSSIVQEGCNVSLHTLGTGTIGMYQLSTTGMLSIGTLNSCFYVTQRRDNVALNLSVSMQSTIAQVRCKLFALTTLLSSVNSIASSNGMAFGTVDNSRYPYGGATVNVSIRGFSAIVQDRCNVSIEISSKTTAVSNVLSFGNTRMSSSGMLTLVSFSEFSSLVCLNNSIYVSLSPIPSTSGRNLPSSYVAFLGKTNSGSYGIPSGTRVSVIDSVVLLRHVTAWTGRQLLALVAVSGDGVTSANNATISSSSNTTTGPVLRGSAALVVQHSLAVGRNQVLAGAPWKILKEKGDTAPGRVVVLLHCTSPSAVHWWEESTTGGSLDDYVVGSVEVVPCHSTSTDTSSSSSSSPFDENGCNRQLSCFGPGTLSVSSTADGRCSCECLAQTKTSSFGGSGNRLLVPCGPVYPRSYFVRYDAKSGAAEGHDETTTPTLGTLSPSRWSPSGTYTASPERSLTQTQTLTQTHQEAATRSLTLTLPTASQTVTSNISRNDDGMRFVAAGKRRTRSVIGVVELVFDDDAAAKGVTGTSATSAALSGTTSITALSQVGKVNGISTVAICAFDEDDASPSFLEVPLQAEIGTSQMRHFTGSVVLSTSVIVVLPLVVHMSLFWLSRHNIASAGGDLSLAASSLVWLRNISRVFIVCVSFIVGGVVQSSVTAIAYGDAVDATLCGVCGLLPATLALAWMAFCTHKAALGVAGYRNDNGITAPLGRWYNSSDDIAANVDVISKWGDAASNSNNYSSDDGGADHSAPSSMVVLYVCSVPASVDSVRSVDHAVVVFALLFDLCVAVVVGIVSGLRPSIPGDCQTSAGVLIVVAVLNLLYHALLRPFRARVDVFFGVLHATLLLALAVAAVVALNQTAESRDSENVSSGMRAFGWISVMQLVAFPVQAIMCGVLYAFAEWNRKQRRVAPAPGGHHSRFGDGGIGLLQFPLASGSQNN